MRTIQRFDLAIGTNNIPIPSSSAVLCVQMLREIPRLFALVDSGQPRDGMCVVLVRTGADVNRDLSQLEPRYIGSCFGANDEFHAFVRAPSPF